MVFPDTPREEYRNNPLEEVICQLRFPTILKIGTTSPADFQDHIRKQFPLYEQGPVIPVPEQIMGILSDSGLEDMFATQMPRLHRFITEDKARSISLQSDFIAFSVSDYKRWQTFREQFEFVEREFRRLYEPQFYTRIGLRYRDVIIRENLGLADRSWGELLNRDLAGLLGHDEASSLVAQTLTAVQMRLPEIEGVQLTLQYGLRPESPQLPADRYFIDADISIEQRTEPNASFELLDHFNRIAGTIFRWAISDTLRNALESEPI